jgi:predicted transcriptional regulator
MKASSIRKLREEHKIDRLEIAAYSGLPEDYIEKIETGEVIALESDLERIKKTIEKIIRNQSEASD